MSAPLPPQFPAFLPRETNIWQAYLTQHPTQFQSLEYNVRVGKGFDPGASFEPNARRAAIMNSQLRIDVVGFDGSTWWLIEVKVRAGAGAVGQLLQYRTLFRKAYPDKIPLSLMMVTDRPKLGLADLCLEHTITLAVPA